MAEKKTSLGLPENTTAVRKFCRRMPTPSTRVFAECKQPGQAAYQSFFGRNSKEARQIFRQINQRNNTNGQDNSVLPFYLFNLSFQLFSHFLKLILDFFEAFFAGFDERRAFFHFLESFFDINFLLALEPRDDFFEFFERLSEVGFFLHIVFSRSNLF